jgi:hypothetical protein
VGHIRLGELPRTRKWQHVIALIECGAGAIQLAQATLAAAEEGLRQAGTDPGVVETFWLLTRLPLAAQSADFAGGLRHCGLNVADAPGLMEIVGALTDALDATMPNNKGRSDLGEMAQAAAAEALTRVVGTKTKSLYGSSPEEVRKAFGDLATVRNFSVFGRAFFARFTYKCIDYFLSRAWAQHVGEGRRFPTLARVAHFSEALEIHCHEAARIVEDYAGEWFSKTNWEQGGIPRSRTVRFTAHAMRKLIDELKRGAQSHVQ